MVNTLKTITGGNKTMNMTKKEFHLILTGLLCIILAANIIMKHYYHSEVTEYFLNIIFFTIFGIGIGDFIQNLIVKQEE